MASQPAPALLLLLAVLLPAQTRTEPTDPEPSPIPTPIPEGNSSAEGSWPLAGTELKAGAPHPTPGRLALLVLLAPLAPRPVLG